MNKNFKTKLGLLVSFLAFTFSFLCNSSFANERVKAAYISPIGLDHPFWGQIVSFMEAVAEDLDIELEIIVESSGNRYLLKHRALKIITSDDPPDYMVISYYPNLTSEIVESANANNVGIFVFNANLSKEDNERIGYPREKYSNFIGHMYPDGTRAGFDLANTLIKEARKKKLAIAGKYPFIALKPPKSYSQDWRVYGFQRRINSSHEAVIAAATETSWTDRKVVIDKAMAALNDHPDATIIWGGSDLMALGGIEAAVALGKTPGKDILIGGMGWAQEALRAVAEGRMAADVGGNFMEGGWALLLLHDYHYGIDFKDELGAKILSYMEILTADNIQPFIKKFGDGDWNQVDFRQFSKKHNKDLHRYDFSLDILLE